MNLVVCAPRSRGTTDRKRHHRHRATRRDGEFESCWRLIPAG